MSDKLKVLLINTAADQGGAAAIAKGLFESLKMKPGIDPVFISGNKSKNQNIYHINSSKIKFLTNVMMFRLLGHEGFLNGKAWSKVLEKYLDWADVVHLHNIHGYYLPISVVKRLLNLPTVWTLHDYWLLTGRCAFPNDCRGYIDKCEQCKLLRHYPAVWFDSAKKGFLEKQELITGSKAVFVTPSHVARQTVIEMGMPSGRVTAIENPLMHMPENLIIKDKFVVRKSLQLPSVKKIALFVSNKVDEPRKAFITLVNALKLLKNSSEWQLVVIGNATQTLISSAPENVLFLGPIIDRQLLFQYFMAADVFINPSLAETFGLVNIEALACGCPVICSDLPVFRELDYGCMNYFETGSAEQLAKQLSSYDHSTFPVNKRLKTAYAVRQRFSLAYTSGQYINLYKQVIANSGNVLGKKA